MTNRKIMFEIILLGIAGLITVGLSIKNIIENSEKEAKLKNVQTDLINKQDLLINLQNNHSEELKTKSDEIIRLQKLLQDKNDTQLELMDRMNNPIPESIKLVFNSNVEISNNELEKLKSTFTSNPNLNNYLPFDSKLIVPEFKQINSFKNLYIRISIVFEKNEKRMEMIFERGPLNLHGYNTDQIDNSFMLSYSSQQSNVIFNGFWLKSNKIIINYKSPSLKDFYNSKTIIKYEFGNPYQVQVGSRTPSIAYLMSNENDLKLNIKTITLHHDNYKINIENLKKINSKSFDGLWK